jgi:lipopolysaccharide/colanic/teichoic acid biosynthesis glycosyltransferase
MPDLTPDWERSPSFPLITGMGSNFGTSRTKRCFDAVAGSALLILLSPLLLLAALLVWMSSPGPVFFRQSRAGINGALFTMLKFRTMLVDQAAVVDQPHVMQLRARGVLYKIEDDPRITRLGNWLRRTSVDELPQLLNVIRGDMSLVGPRPLVPFMLVGDAAELQQRSSVRPGITGLWQINARARNLALTDMIDFDLQYVCGCSLRTDLTILLKTIHAVLSGQGAV